MPSIAETRQELVHLVLPEHANIQGNLFGGRMMYWITAAGTLPALRLARRSVVLGSMEDLDFLAPVRVGDMVFLRSQIEHVGRSSMEVGVEVEAENPRTGERRRATSAHLSMVAVDDTGSPQPVGETIRPAGADERALAAAARARKEARDRRLDARAEPETEALPPRPIAPVAGAGPRHAIEVSRIVFPEDAVAGSKMFAGTLLLAVDEVASILAARYARGFVVTASVDGLDFHAPILVGNIVTYLAAINFVGRTSLEVGVRVIAENPREGTLRHTCTAYLTSVHIGPDGRPAALPPLLPETPDERRRWQEAEARRALRQARRAALA
ncbi:MAG TPA: hotdog domain-containing protein [bacterium]|nr:hotdog domain-containing protein [bacterium]